MPCDASNWLRQDLECVSAVFPSGHSTQILDPDVNDPTVNFRGSYNLQVSNLPSTSYEGQLSFEGVQIVPMHWSYDWCICIGGISDPTLRSIYNWTSNGLLAKLYLLQGWYLY